MTALPGKTRSVVLLLLAEVAAMSLWFVSAAVLPAMQAEFDLSPFVQASLSSSVQAGFVTGALVSAVLGIADRYDPRRVFAASAIAAGLINALLLIVHPASGTAIAARFMTGALLAGVYPVGMKIITGWGIKDRGFLTGALVGALTLGSAAPHLIALAGGANWRITIIIASLAAISAGIAGLFTGLGPHHVLAARFNPRAIATAWTNRQVRLAYAGYLGHMWELYAMWAWVAAATAASYEASMPAGDARWWARLTAFIAIAAGGISCVYAGRAADRIGRAGVAIIAMVISATCAVLAGATFAGPVWLTFAIVVVWGLSVIADSAQFSALVADACPPDQAGSLMTLQTALGFALTIVTVQATPVLAAMYGWPMILAAMAIGPAFGVIAMSRLLAMRTGNTKE